MVALLEPAKVKETEALIIDITWYLCPSLRNVDGDGVLLSSELIGIACNRGGSNNYWTSRYVKNFTRSVLLSS